MKYIITCNENSKQHLIDELQYYRVNVNLTWFNETDALLEMLDASKSFEALYNSLPLIFIRHYFKVDGILPIEVADSLSDAIALTSSVFSIQMRTPVTLRKALTALRNDWVDAFIAKGNELNVKNPEWVVSVYATEAELLYGLSHIDTLPTRWSAGEIHFSKKIESISRAEFKLREIFDTFPLNVVGDVAVDLGAAPGGWTRVLHEMDYEVYAIDPAELDFRLDNVEGIHHYRMTSQEFVDQNPHFECDILVNDMKMSAKQSIAIFKEAARQLNEEGIGIITIKLNKDYSFNDALNALELLKQHFEVIHARQLFHNRHEFTAIVRKN